MKRIIRRYKCKDCQKEMIIPEQVYKLMAERGESLPERCDECKKSHKEKVIKQVKCPYFQIERESEKNFTPFDYYKSAYTFHGDRPRPPRKIDFHPPKMRIKITDDHIEDLYKLLEKNQVVVLSSPTGTGKSIYILYRLIEQSSSYSGDFVKELLRQGQVIQTQPLSSATERIPNTIAGNLLGEPEESKIGPYKMLGLRHREKEKYSRHNLGVVVTDGSLRNWVRDGYLGQYSLIMIDEAHKRTLNIDTLLLLLKHKLSLYPHLRLIISSATINIHEFEKEFEKEGISVGIFDLSKSFQEEKNYYVHFWKGGKVVGCDCWLCQNNKIRENFWKDKKNLPQETQLPNTVATFVIEILKQTEEGGILIFLSGEAIIEKAKKLIVERKRRIDPKGEISVITVYRRLEEIVGGGEVEKRFNQQGKKRRILLTTDIAETSHTLEDIVYVLDSGYIKESQWDPETQTSSLPTVRHSQAGCKQRWGRVGRTKKGYVYCFYTEEQFNNNKEFKKQTIPEVYRSPFDDVLLNLKAGGISEIPSLIGEPLNKELVQTEIKRASKTLTEEGFIDEKGNVTEKGFEIFHIPKSSSEIALMNLADEQNCFMEMITTLPIIMPRESVISTGINLYHPLNGLLIWDPRWTARTKMEIWRIHQAFQVGCKDDLDFVTKLTYCLLKAEKKERGKEWALRHFVNYDFLKKIILQRQELIDIYQIKVKEKREKEKIREVEPDLIDRVRTVLATILPKEDIAELEKKDKSSIYKWQTKKGTKISKYCTGNWKKGDKALLTAKEKVAFDKCSVASFIVKLPKESKITNKVNLFVDQRYPVGSQVLVNKMGSKNFISKIVKLPSPIKIDYGMRTSFEMLLEDFLRSSYLPKGETIYYEKEFINNEIKEYKSEFEAIWIDERRSKSAKIVEWTEIDGYPKAIIAPIDDLLLLSKLRKNKKVGDTLRVKIEHVVRDPNDKVGWILSKTQEGLEIPVNTGDMGLSHYGYGLERIKGKWLDLQIKEFESVMRRPRLSNLAKIMEDLGKIRGEILSAKKNTLSLEGYVEEIEEDGEKVIAVVPRELGIIHFFEIKSGTKGGIPKEEFPYLKIGEKVTISLSIRKGEDRKCYINLFRDLQDHEIKSYPWGRDFYDNEKNTVFFPYGIKENQLEYWEAPQELKEALIKISWRHIFDSKINFREEYKLLEKGEIIEGKVIKIMKYSDTGKIAGVQVQIKKEDVKVIGFVPYSELYEKTKSWIKEVSRVDQVEEAMNFKVTKSGPIILSQKKIIKNR